MQSCLCACACVLDITAHALCRCWLLLSATHTQMDALPVEIILGIFRMLDFKELLSASQVCHSWYRVSCDFTLWRSHYNDRWACCCQEPSCCSNKQGNFGQGGTARRLSVCSPLVYLFIVHHTQMRASAREVCVFHATKHVLERREGRTSCCSCYSSNSLLVVGWVKGTQTPETHDVQAGACLRAQRVLSSVCIAIIVVCQVVKCILVRSALTHRICSANILIRCRCFFASCARCLPINNLCVTVYFFFVCLSLLLQRNYRRVSAAITMSYNGFGDTALCTGTQQSRLQMSLTLLVRVMFSPLSSPSLPFFCKTFHFAPFILFFLLFSLPSLSTRLVKFVFFLFSPLYVISQTERHGVSWWTHSLTARKTS